MAGHRQADAELVTHRGGCHCGAVRFECDASPHLTILECNCSICRMKQNHHFIVPKERFRLLQGQEKLTLYQFNTKRAQHLFCSVCGVQAFYGPRSHPGSRAVTMHCLDPGTVQVVTVKKCDGENWEEWHQKFTPEQHAAQDYF